MKIKHYEPSPGADFFHETAKCLEYAAKHNVKVILHFNDTRIRIKRNSKPSSLWVAYQKGLKSNWEEYTRTQTKES